MRKFEELTKEEQDVWRKFAERHQFFGKVLQAVNDDGCPKCKYRPKTWNEFEFHFSSTHGIPRETLIDVIQSYEKHD